MEEEDIPELTAEEREEAEQVSKRLAEYERKRKRKEMEERKRETERKVEEDRKAVDRAARVMKWRKQEE